MREKYVITISHLLGCGGAYVGKKLSEELSIPFIDNQILKRVSGTLGLPEKDIEGREEKKTSFWGAFLRAEAFAGAMPTTEENMAALIPSDEEICSLETRYIKEIARERSCVILGRGGSYILRDHPRHLRVFVYADTEFRVKRVAELYNVPPAEALKIMRKNDKERGAYIRAFTGSDMLRLEQYDICVDVSALGADNAAEIVRSALDAKLENRQCI